MASVKRAALRVYTQDNLVLRQVGLHNTFKTLLVTSGRKLYTQMPSVLFDGRRRVVKTFRRARFVRKSLVSVA
jgi:hypothetical protein